MVQILTVKYISPSVFKQALLFLAHFDIAHAGFPNASRNRSFHAPKFVFARTSCPSTPSWDNQSSELPFVEAETSRIYFTDLLFILFGIDCSHSNVKLMQEELAFHDSGECRSSDQRLRFIYDAEEVLLPKTA